MWRLTRWVLLGPLPFVVLGAIFILLGWRAHPADLTDDGYSLKWFWYVMGSWFIGLTLVVFGGIYIWAARSGNRLRRIRERGRRGLATVLEAEATGGMFNNLPQVEMQLQVYIDGMQSYTLTHREYMDLLNLAALRKGAQVAVLVDPSDPREVQIDWANSTDSPQV
ncbi:MAG: DUF3592 domain-containing protein [Acidobacteriota bacterium]